LVIISIITSILGRKYIVVAEDAVPLICALALFGSQSNLVVVDLTDENTVIDAQHNVAASNRALETPTPALILSFSRTPSVACPSTSQELAHMAAPSQQHTPATDGDTLIPITEYTADDAAQNNRICLNNICYIAKDHGFDIEKLHPGVFTTSANGSTGQALPVVHAPTPGHEKNVPTAESLLIPITAENAAQSSRVSLHNIRHIAKHHGFDIEKLHPEVFTTSAKGSTGQASPVVLAPAPDNFTIGNDVDGNDPDAVAMEQ